jgi:hypothetical protein
MYSNAALLRLTGRGIYLILKRQGATGKSTGYRGKNVFLKMAGGGFAIAFFHASKRIEERGKCGGTLSDAEHASSGALLGAG